MRVRAALLIAALLAVPALGQGPIPDRPVDQPRPQGGSSGGGPGFPGIGLSLSLGGKKFKEPPLTGPPLQMQDQTIADYVPGEVLFFTKGTPAQIARIARTARLTVLSTEALDELGVFMVLARIAPGDTVEAATARLAGQGGVEWAQPNHQFQVLAGSSSREKGLALHKLTIGPKVRVTGTIVLIDSAVDLANPALKGAAIQQRLFGIDAAPSPHGTAIAEILVGTGPFSGVASGATIASLAAFAPASEKSWLSQTRSLALAMNAGVKLRPQVVNLSFGAARDDEALRRLLGRFESEGACVVAAAGNGSGGPVLFPARLASSIAVTAIDGKKRAYAYASKGPEIDLAAWGVDMNAAVPGGRRAVSGTSFATAVVSGALLRFHGCNGGRDPAGMRTGLAALAQDLGPKGRDPVYGAGLFRLGK
jgi:Subtilase family